MAILDEIQDTDEKRLGERLIGISSVISDIESKLFYDDATECVSPCKSYSNKLDLLLDSAENIRDRLLIINRELSKV